MMVSKRGEGTVQPGIKWGKYFTLRIPGIHVDFNWPVVIQGSLLYTATNSAAAPLLMRAFGISFEQAWALSAVGMFWLFIGSFLLGDVFAPGWITPSIPLTLVFLGGFETGVQSIQAMIAVTLIVSVLFLFFAVTGLGERFFRWIPLELRAGIILGSAIAAFNAEFVRHATLPITLSVVWIVLLVLMFSTWVAKSKDTNKFIRGLASMAMLTGFLVAAVAGPLSGEIAFQIEWGIFVPPFAEAIRAVNPFFIGWPSWDIFVRAFPLGIMIYIIAFGDLILGNTLVQDAGRVRTDELLEINPTRTHYQLAIRNFGQLLTSGPWIPMQGPIWTGVHVFLVEQYKLGRKTMDSLYSGTINWYWLAFLLVFLTPIVTFMEPILPVALSITMILTGFACTYIAMRMVTTPTAQGYSLFVALVIVKFGPAWGLIVGALFFFLLLVQKKPAIAIPYDIKMDK